MRNFCIKYHRAFTLLFTASLLSLLAACSTDWVSQANAIISVLVPSIVAALGILSAFGVGVSPEVLTAVQKWAAEAQHDLQNVVKPLIDEYNAASAGAKPGILSEIQTALGVISGNLETLIASIHVTNPRTQAQIKAIFSAIQSELVALGNLVPVLQGKVASTHEQMKAVHALKSARQFRDHFNGLTAEFGEQYQIK